MTTSLLGLAARIESEARQLQPRRAALLVVALPLWALGWAAGAAFRAAWVVAAWAWTAVAIGFRDGRSG